MRYAFCLGFIAILSACGGGAEQPSDEELIASVEAVNGTPPPVEEVVPEAIRYPDIERNDIYGASCSYAPGTSLGARAIARPKDAFMKIDGEIVRFAADPGARALPLGTRSLYTGLTYSLHLAISGDGEATMSETTLYEGTITLRDAHGRVVYTGTGTASCGV